MARKPMMAGNWKMNNTIAEAVVLTQEISNQYDKEWPESVDIVICPPYVDLMPAKTVLDFDKTKVAVNAQNVLEPEGRLHGGDLGAHDQGDRLRGQHRWPLRAPRAVRRDERGREPQGEGARRGGPVRHRVRGRVAGRARRGHHRGVRVRPGARRLRRRGRRRAGLRRGLRAHLGHRHGPHGHARAGRGRVRRHPRDARRPLRRRGGRGDARAVRRLHEPRQRGGPAGPAEHRRRPHRRRQPAADQRASRSGELVEACL